MSNFDTFANITQGDVGTAPAEFTATTPDVIGVVTASGYLSDLAASGWIKVGDIIHLNYDSDGTPGWTTGYVTNPSGVVFNFVQGVQGVAPGLLLIKKSVNNYALAGGAAAQTITDASILSTDIVIVVTQATTTATAYQLHTVAGSGSAVVTFNADPGASTVDYILVATV